MSRSFDGVGDNITFGSKSNLDDLSNLTFGGWYFFRASAAVQTLIAKGTFSGITLLDTFSDNSIRFFKICSGTDITKRTGASAFPDNEWFHVACTWVRGLPSGNARIYINGVEAASYQTEISGTIAVGNDAGGDLRIGEVEASEDLNGLVSHIFYHNVILTRGEIIHQMRFPGSVRRGLLVYAPLFGGSSPEPDLSGFQNNGVVTGATKGSGPPVGRFSGFNRNRMATMFPAAAVAPSDVQISGSRLFNGSSDAVDLGNNLNDLIGASYTVMAWIFSDGITGTQKVIHYGSTSQNDGRRLFDLDVFSGNARFAVQDDNGNSAAAELTASISNNTWTHVAGVRTGDSVRVFVNSTQFTSTNQTSGIGETIVDQLLVGANVSGAASRENFFDGRIAQVQVFNRELNQREIRNAMVFPGSIK